MAGQRESDARHQGEAPAQGTSAPTQSVTPEQARAQRIVWAAKKYNDRHPELVQEFNKATGGACATDYGLSVRYLMMWQREHGLPPDGRISRVVVHLAKKNQPKGKEEVSFSEGEAGTVRGEGPTGEIIENPELLEHIFGGAAKMERVEKEGVAEPLGDANEVVSKVNDANTVAHATEGLEGGESQLFRLAMVPAVLALIHEGRYADAVKFVAQQVAPSEAFEAVLGATERIGLHIGRPVLKWLVSVGAEANVLWALINWTLDGIEKVQEAHERGDQKSRIRMYGFAFADGFLYGEGADGNRSAAVTAEQKEAVENGLRDGAATAAGLGENGPVIARELLRRYKSETAVKRVIMDGLAKKAGLPGVWS